MTGSTDSWIDRLQGGATLEPAARAELAAQARSMRLEPGTCVFSPGDVCSSWLVVVSGSIRVQMIADTGREVVLYRVGNGESCLLTTACLLGEELYSAEGIVETETWGIAVPMPAFRKLIGTSDRFRSLVFSGLGRRITDILTTLEEVAFHRLDARLARLLLRRAPGGALDTTHQDIAADLGSAREVVSRQLKTFERQGLVALERGRVVLADRAALERLASLGTGGTAK